MTWTTYNAANPVISNPPVAYQDQYQNFRDPFVYWHAESRKWVVITDKQYPYHLVLLHIAYYMLRVVTFPVDSPEPANSRFDCGVEVNSSP
jgi:hypothetical protein